MDHNLILTGFMGTGKSTVGPAAAERLGMAFVDMDPLIETRAGMSISQIFDTRGEPAFRQMEGALCCELAGRRGLVVATGGGALLCPENRQMLGETGLIVCLTCSVDEILKRLAHASDRPLIAGDDRAAHIKALLAQRGPIYAALPAQVDTTGATLDEVVAQVIARWERWKVEA